MRIRAALAVAFAALVATAPILAAPARAATFATVSQATAQDAAPAGPKVVIVVGATEATTSSYRTDADSIATEALKWTSNVVKVYSPNATWSVVAAAAKGASIFVYLGHGNGFPSPYSTTLQPATQDGMGLNTTLGLSDSDKKYYGEASVATLRLAPNAVVFLNHLCYAPGSGEPGAPEPSVSTAEQRVDNFASGFIRAGARAVMADDYSGSVEAAIHAIFTTHQSFLSVWRSEYAYHGHEIAFVPARNQAFQAILDPETWTTHFYRSVETDAALTTDDVVAGAALAPTNVAPTTLTAPGAAVVGATALAVDTAQDLATTSGATLAPATKVRVDTIVPGTTAPDGSTSPASVQVQTLDAGVQGWVSGDGLAPADSASPALRSMTGVTTISPNYDGVNDSLNLWARLSEAAPWTWTLTDPDGTTLRTQTGTTDLFALTWDAMPGGSPAPAGTYHWSLHAADAWGNPALDTGGDITVVTLPVPAPAVKTFTSTVGSTTNAATLTYQLGFNLPVSGLTAAGFAATGTATGCVVGDPTGAGMSWSVGLTGCSEGTVVLTLAANAVQNLGSVTGPAASVAGPAVLVDRTAPTTNVPPTALRGSVTLGGFTFSSSVSLSATDAGSGVASYDIARSLDGAAFSVIASNVTTASIGESITSGHHYRFEVRAHDRAGNISGWVAGPTLGPILVQQTSTGITWSTGWATLTSTSFSGGTARTATKAGASASYVFTGRGVGILVARDPTYGQVKLYLDGTYLTTVDTKATTHGNRYVVYARAVTLGTHTLKLVVVGTSGRPRVVLDGFEVLR
jgi:hypothetical protein